MSITLSSNVLEDVDKAWLQHKDALLAGKIVFLDKIVAMVKAENMDTNFHP